MSYDLYVKHLKGNKNFKYTLKKSFKMQTFCQFMPKLKFLAQDLILH